jgi:hypothetical protein
MGRKKQTQRKNSMTSTAPVEISDVCPHCEYDARHGVEPGHVYPGNGAPIGVCPLCKGTGKWKPRQVGVSPLEIALRAALKDNTP